MAGEIVQPRATGFFIVSLNSSRKEVVELSFDEVAKLSCQKKNGATMFESLKDGEYYTFFTDCDHYCQTIEPPDDDYIDDVKERMMTNLGKLLNDQFTDEHKGTFGMATRHGVHVEKNVYKLSWRCYFFGFVLTLSEMRKVIVKKGLDKAGIGSLDSSPYNKNQLLGCVGFCKSQIDKRILVPCDASQPLEKFMVQNVTGDEVVLDYDDQDEGDNNFEELVEDRHDIGNFEHPRFAPPWEILERLIMNLDVQKRCKGGTYQQWARIGWALAGIARAAERFEDGLTLWVQFCRQCMDAYLENPMKAQIIYRCAKNRNEQLGWTSLMEALKEDSPDTHVEISRQLSQASSIDDDELLKLVSTFLSDKFRCRPKLVASMRLFEKDGYRYLIVDSRDTFCPIIKDEHPVINSVYYVFSPKLAKEKCRHPDCKDKCELQIEASAYPDQLRDRLDGLLRNAGRAEKVLHDLLLSHKEKDFTSKMDLTQIGEKQVSCLQGDRYDLPKNKYCPIHQCHHENAENCLMLSSNFGRLGVLCRQDPFTVYPADGITVPPNIVNVFIQNANFNGGTLQGGTTLLATDYDNDELPFFSDKAETKKFFIESFSGKHNKLARFVHALWGHEFRYFDKSWYCFEQHIWNAIDDVPLLRNRLSDQLCGYFIGAQHHYRNHSHIKQSKAKIDILESTISHLQTAHFKDSVMKEVVEVFQIENRGFARSINQADLLPFSNGVLELDTLNFRPGRPTDKMTMSTRIEYRPYSDTDDTVLAIDDFVASILPETSVKRYLLKLSALCLTRENKHQKIWIVTGNGSNGKSLYLDLLSKTLGDFAATTRVQVLTEPSRSASGAQSEIAKLEFARLVTFNEPPKTGIIQADIVKKFAGGTDKISTRELHKSEREFVPVFKPILACNTIPSISEDSHAVWRRIRLIDFPVRFTDSPDPEDPCQKLSDETLEERMKDWAPHMAGYLVHWLTILRIEGLTEPNAVLRRTSEYRDDNDQFKEFVDEFIVSASTNDFILWNDLMGKFRPWYEPRFKTTLSKKGRDVQQIKDYFNSKLGKIRRTEISKTQIYGYFGWSFAAINVSSSFLPEDSDDIQNAS